MDPVPGVAGRRVEAVVVAGAAPADDLLTAAVRQAREGGVEVRVTDDVDGALRELWAAGTAAADVLVLLLDAAAAAPDGPAVARVGTTSAAAVLLDQAARRRRRELPSVRPPTGWGLGDERADTESERVWEALLALADGRVGVTGAPLAAHPSARPLQLSAGLWDGDGPETELLPGPVALHLPYELPAMPTLRRVLDLRTGLFEEQEQTTSGPLTAVRFASLARPGTVVLRAQVPDRTGSGDGLLAPSGGRPVEQGTTSDACWMRVPATTGGVTVAARTDEIDLPEGGLVIDRVASHLADPDVVPAVDDAVQAVATVAEAGFDRLLREHRRAWAQRWEGADVEVHGDDDLTLATRLMLFQLMGSVASEGEAGVGPRGLTGSGYRGHVFWDADTFVLPFLAATHPPSARAMLEYRLRRLPQARAAAAALGREGARFPWESARTGEDVTPRSAYDRQGHLVAIRTGELEEHIVAQVAWAACCYADWTGDAAFAGRQGLRLLVETARYWASRLEVDDDGTVHVRHVIGPDEYHEDVDDDAFTNGMARWNLRRAADAVDDPTCGRAGVPPAEVARWRALADAVVDGYDEATGTHEEFAGFSALEPLLIAEVAPRRPIAADLLLGRERVLGAQVVKQPAVLMLHHLVPGDLPAGSLVRDLDRYEPRTAHGSSLSPGIHASLQARAGRPDTALETLRTTARLDLDDLTGTTAGGVHVATGGSLWQALVTGFAGVRPFGGRLEVDPQVPAGWDALEVRLGYRGRRLRLRCSSDELELHADGPVPVTAGGVRTTVDGAPLRMRRRAQEWEIA